MGLGIISLALSVRQQDTQVKDTQVNERAWSNPPCYG